MVWLTVHTNPLLKRSFSKTPSKRDEPYLNSYHKDGNQIVSCMYFRMKVTSIFFIIRNILIELQTYRQGRFW